MTEKKELWREHGHVCLSWRGRMTVITEVGAEGSKPFARSRFRHVWLSGLTPNYADPFRHNGIGLDGRGVAGWRRFYLAIQNPARSEPLTA